MSEISADWGIILSNWGLVQLKNAAFDRCVISEDKYELVNYLCLTIIRR